jgi:hypothetical protein
MDAASVAGRPWIVWQERAVTGVSWIRVATLTPTGWTRVGAVPRLCVLLPTPCAPVNADATRDAYAAHIADVGGVPWIIWTEESATPNVGQAHVARLDGTTGRWTRVGGALNIDPAMNVDDTSITAIGGVPYVAWRERFGPNSVRVHVAHLNAAGTGWDRDDGPSGATASSNSFSPRIAEVGGAPTVSWMTGQAVQGRSALVSARLTAPGTFVSSVPLVGGPDRISEDHSLADLGGAPALAYVDSTSGDPQLRVSRLAGGAWLPVGAPVLSATGEGPSHPRIVVRDGTPWVTWAGGAPNERIRVARLTQAGTWEQVSPPPGGIGDAGARNLQPTLMFNGGVPVVVFVALRRPDPQTTEVPVRALQLVPDITAVSAAPAGSSATVSADLQTHGVPVSVGFEYGVGAASTQTPLAEFASPGTITATRLLTGLTPGQTYQLRVVMSVGGQLIRGPLSTFTTTGAQTGPGTGGTGGTASPGTVTKRQRMSCRRTGGVTRCRLTLTTRLPRGTRVRVVLRGAGVALATSRTLRVGARGRLVVVVTSARAIRAAQGSVAVTRLGARRAALSVPVRLR